MLDLPQVGAVIVGARSQAHLAANLKIAEIKLTDQDRREIGAILAQRQGPDGDTFELMTSADPPTVVETIPGWTHDITNVGNGVLVSLLWASETFDRSRPDTVVLPV